MNEKIYIQAGLDTIAFAEGTDNGKQPTNNHGYDVIVGGALFDDYSKHPNVLVDLPRLGIKSTAAGRYQILKRYADHYTRELKLPDFGPESQDKIALKLIGECGALRDLKAGRAAEFITKCKSRWASLPGAGYGQHEYKLQTLVDYYNERVIALS